MPGLKERMDELEKDIIEARELAEDNFKIIAKLQKKR